MFCLFRKEAFVRPILVTHINVQTTLNVYDFCTLNDVTGARPHRKTRSAGYPTYLQQILYLALHITSLAYFPFFFGLGPGFDLNFRTRSLSQ